MTKAYASDVTAGNLLVVVAAAYASSITITITDSRSSSYSNSQILDSGVGNGRLQIAWAVAPSSGANTVTATYGVSSGGGFLAIYEVNTTTGTWIAGLSAGTTGNDETPASGNFSALHNDGFLVGAAIATSVSSWTAGSGWTTDFTPNSFFFDAVESQVVTSTGTYNANWSVGTATTWGAVGAGFEVQPSGHGSLLSSQRNRLVIG